MYIMYVILEHILIKCHFFDESRRHFAQDIETKPCYYTRCRYDKFPPGWLGGKVLTCSRWVDVFASTKGEGVILF